jgi:hypothetical protein
VNCDLFESSTMSSSVAETHADHENGVVALVSTVDIAFRAHVANEIRGFEA